MRGLGVRDLGLGIRAAPILVLVALAAGCGSKGSPAAPSPQVNQTEFSVRIDGAAWTTTRAFVSSQAGNAVITASDTQPRAWWGLCCPAQLRLECTASNSLKPVTVTYFEGGPNMPAWTSFSPAARGEVNLTTVTEKSVVGTLSVVLVPFSPAASGPKNIEGTFTIAR
jgi:hypothetical protein